MAYSDISELPTQVRLSLSEDDQKYWMEMYNSKAGADPKKARIYAWRCCSERPSSFSFSAYASVDDWDVQGEKIAIPSLMKTMDRYLESGAPLSWEHKNYTIGLCWDYEPIKKDGRDGIKIYGNLFGGDKGVYDSVRKKFMNGTRGFSVAGESGGTSYECSDGKCGRVLKPSEVLEIALTSNPANKHAVTIDFHEGGAFAKSTNTGLRFTDVSYHMSEHECPILKLRKSLRDHGIDAHARPDGVFVAMDGYTFAKSLGRFNDAQLVAHWTDGGVLLQDRDDVIERTFRDGFAKGYIDKDGTFADDVDMDFFCKAVDDGIVCRSEGSYHLMDPSITEFLG